jgi:excisionase family DNA binding protein
MSRRTINGELLDVRSAATLLGCSEKTLRARVARRLVPFRKFSGRVVFRRKELDAFLEAMEGCSVKEALKNSQ